MRAAEKPRPKNQNVFQKVRPPSGGTFTTGWCVSSSLTLAVLATSAGDFNLIENKNFRATSALLRDSVHLHFEWFWARFLWKWLSPWPPSTVCFVSPKNPADSLSVYVLRYVWKHGPWSSGNKLEKRETWILILFEVLGARESAVAADVCLSAHLDWFPLKQSTEQSTCNLRSDHIPNRVY